MTSVENKYVKKQYGNTLVTIEEKQLNRAKELIWKHGAKTGDVVAQILEHEMGRRPHDDEINFIVSIAICEMAEQRKGYRQAIADLHKAAEVANAPGKNHNLDLWAIYLASASFLEGFLEGKLEL